MANEKQNFLTAIDVGSAKTVALTAEITDQGLRYAAHGVCESRGTRKGGIVDLEKSVTSIQAAVQQAEDVIGVSIERAVVGIGGPHVRGVNTQGAIALGSRAREISRDDVRQVTEKAKSITIPADRKMLHVVAQEFVVDGHGGILQDPVQMVGTRLEMRAHVVTVLRTAEQNVVTAVNRAGVQVDNQVFEPYAAAHAVLTPDERELGVCLLDVGAASTDVVVYYENTLYHTGSVRIGGEHFTNDAAVGLCTPVEDAEKLKRLFGNCVVTQVPQTNEIEVPSVGERPARMIEQRRMAEFLECRARDLFEHVRDHLREAGVLRDDGGDIIPTGFVMTGGGAKLAGILDVADQVLRKPARIGVPLPVPKMPSNLLDPEFATVIGVLLYGYATRNARPQHEDSPIGKLKALFARKNY